MQGKKTEALTTTISGIAGKDSEFLNTEKNIAPQSTEYGNSRLYFNMSHWNRAFDNEKKA